MNNTTDPSGKPAGRWLAGMTIGMAFGLLSCSGTWLALRVKAAGLPADLDAGERFALNLDALLLGGKVWLVSLAALALLLLARRSRQALAGPAALAVGRVIAWAGGLLWLAFVIRSWPALLLAGAWLSMHGLLGWFALARRVD